MPSLRLSFLTLTFVAVSLTLVKIILEPKIVSTSRQYKPYNFPETIALKQWNLDRTKDKIKPTTLTQKPAEQFSGAKLYQYSRNGLKVDINMYYLVNTTGNVNEFIKYYLNNSSPSNTRIPMNIKQQQKIGYYNVFLHDKKIQILSCINPRGGATANISQFMLNRQRYDYSNSGKGADKWVSWFLGQEDIQDRRCMWSHLSMPINNLPPQKAFEEIEKVWFSWYDWWQNNFPEP